MLREEPRLSTSGLVSHRRMKMLNININSMTQSFCHDHTKIIKISVDTELTMSDPDYCILVLQTPKCAVN